MDFQKFLLSTDDENVLVKLLEADEGFREYPYDDATGERVRALHGNITIGIGINLDQKLDYDEAVYLCKWRCRKLQIGLNSGLPFYGSLDTVRKIVLLCMSYNLGLPRFMGFKKMIAAMQAEDWKEASREILDSKAARDLPNRYARFANMMITGLIKK